MNIQYREPLENSEFKTN